MSRIPAKRPRKPARAVARAAVARVLPNPAPVPRLNKTGISIGPKLAAKVERGIRSYNAGRFRSFKTAEDSARWIFGDDE